MAPSQQRRARGPAPDSTFDRLLRYRFALPLLAGADLWIDLGCGNGRTPSVMVGAIDPAPRRTMLVDVDPGLVDVAARDLALLQPKALVADLSEPAGLEALTQRTRELASDGDRVVITCLETLARLPRFSHLVEWLCERADQGADILLSVPNDPFGMPDDQDRETKWGEAALAELRSLLPTHRAFAQFPLGGSWIVPDGDDAAAIDVATEAGDASVPSHFLIALGPRRESLSPAAGATRTDLSERRRWERHREASLSWLEQRVSDLESARPGGASPEDP